MAKRPIGTGDGGGTKTPAGARTDSNVTRIPVAGRRQGVAEEPVPSKLAEGGQSRVPVSGEPGSVGESAVPETGVPQGQVPSDDDLTADALRHALDRGAGGDKVDFIDPAAAPLGTDDEAGGHPPTREQILAAAREELGPARSPEERRVRRTIPLRARDGLGLGLVLVAVILAGVLLAVVL